MATSMATSITTQNKLYTTVENAYSFRSENAISESIREKIASSLGYDPTDTVHIPVDANIGEGCGNPLLIASLKEGETVVDLGSGGGFDCLLASKQVGPNGKVVGVDMTKNMIELARRNATKMGATNTEFIHSKINQIPLPDNSVDCVMSNCVLNLVPDEDKLSVIEEIHRVLKPGGRIAVSDYLALKPLPDEIKNDEMLHAGCVSGALAVGLMRDFLFNVGFDDVLLLDMQKNLEIFKDEDGRKFVTPCCAGDSSDSDMTSTGRKETEYNLNEWISSFQIYGQKWSREAEQHPPVITSVGASQPTKQQQGSKQCCGPKNCC